ncbi:MAG: putative DNA binding domain-containing protein [bacterium]|nr:putative DNA binding domain-containing protein [bacterium]
MTTAHEINEIAAKGESDAVEFKKTTGEKKEAAKTLSAMLNGQGGTVLFGVHPRGQVVGQNVSEKTLENITQACREIHPWHPPTIERVSLSDKADHEILVATVGAGAHKPYSYKGLHYIRSGASTVRMPEETHLALIMERAHGWDRWETASSRLSLDAIDEREVEAFRDTAISAGRGKFDTNAPTPAVFRAMNLLDRNGNPNRGAVALFGRPDAFDSQYPTLGCRLVAVEGTHLGEDYKDDLLVVNNIFVSLQRAMTFCQEHLHHPVRINGGLQAEAGLEIPSAVIREALANAFGHRDYAKAGLVQVRVFSDRLEVLSPGGLHFGLTTDDLYKDHGSHPWNPNMIGCLYRRGIVEQLGSGTLRMARMCADMGLGRPIFTTSGASVTCSVPRRGRWLATDGSSLTLGTLETSVLTLLADGPNARGEIATKTGINETVARSLLIRLRDMGLVAVEGYGRGAYWTLNNTPPN